MNQDNQNASQIYNSTLNAKYGTQAYAQNQYAQNQMYNVNNYNQNVQSAIDLYKQNMAQQNVARQQAEQYANIGLKAQGMAGTGESSSTLLGIQNAYMGNINQANANLANNIAAYNQQYDNDQLAARQQYNQDMAGVQEQAMYDETAALNALNEATTEEEFNNMLNEFRAEYGEDFLNSVANKYSLNAKRQELQYSDELNKQNEANIVQIAKNNGIKTEINPQTGKETITQEAIPSAVFQSAFPKTDFTEMDLKDGDIIKADFTDKDWRGKNDKWYNFMNKEYYVYLNGNFYAYDKQPQVSRVKYKIKNGGKIKKK